MRRIEGTNKFVIYMYNGKNIRRTEKAYPEHFVGKQWGRIEQRDENNKVVKNYPFSDYGQMIHFINTILLKQLKKNLRTHETWRK